MKDTDVKVGLSTMVDFNRRINKLEAKVEALSKKKAKKDDKKE